MEVDDLGFRLRFWILECYAINRGLCQFCKK